MVWLIHKMNSSFPAVVLIICKEYLYYCSKNKLETKEGGQKYKVLYLRSWRYLGCPDKQPTRPFPENKQIGNILRRFEA